MKHTLINREKCHMSSHDVQKNQTIDPSSHSDSMHCKMPLASTLDSMLAHDKYLSIAATACIARSSIVAQTNCGDHSLLSTGPMSSASSKRNAGGRPRINDATWRDSLSAFGNAMLEYV